SAAELRDVGAHGRASGAQSLAPLRRAPRSLASFVAGFKATVTTRINAFREMPGTPVWQRNYYEHVIRDTNDLDQIRQYITTNPIRWSLDPYHL
ncbi:MAG: transposase, partial [Chloroflexota bacterium]